MRQLFPIWLGVGVFLSACEPLTTGPAATPSDAVSDLTGQADQQVPDGAISSDTGTNTPDTGISSDVSGAVPGDQATPGDPETLPSPEAANPALNPTTPGQTVDAGDDDNPTDDSVVAETEVAEGNTAPDGKIKRALAGRLFEFQPKGKEDKLGLVSYKADGTFEWSSINQENRKSGRWWTQDGQYCDDSGKKVYFDGRRSQCVDFGEDADDYFIAKTRLRPL